LPKDGNVTREKILDVALRLVMDRGYGGMTLDAVIEEAGITKGTLYYHFDGKAALARAMVERFVEADLTHYWNLEERAQKLSKDPLQRMLIAVGLAIEELSDPELAPNGCLYASFCYQSGLLEPQIHEIVRDALRFWREKLGARFREIMQLYPPKIDVDPDALADQFTSAFEGGFVMARGLDEPDQLVKALEHYRNYLELLFEPAQSPIDS